MKTNPLVVLLVILIIAVAGLTGYLIYLNNNTTKPVPVATTKPKNTIESSTTTQDLTEEELRVSIEYCQKVDPLVANSCFGKIAAAKNDVTICDQYVKFDLNGTCRTEVAINQNNIDAYQNLSPAYKEKCYNVVARTTKNPAICDQIPEPEQDYQIKSICYAEVGKEMQDIAICSKIEQQNWKDSCYAWIAAAKNDLNVCKYSSDQEEKDNCFTDVAVANKDLSVCERIESKKGRENCHYEMAPVMKKPELCDGLVEMDYLKSFCYRLTAEKMKDPTVCNKIPDEAEKENCISWAK